MGFTLIDTAAYLTLHTDGTLAFDMEDGTLWYQRTGDVPAKAAAAPETAPTAEPQAASGAGDFDPAAYIEKKFIMTDADMEGYNMTAAMLGGYEYSLVLHEDGTVDFMMAGAEIPGLTWTTGMIATEAGNVEGFLLDYYTDKLNVVPTEKGLDMDYFGSMLMHFAAEE